MARAFSLKHAPLRREQIVNWLAFLALLSLGFV